MMHTALTRSQFWATVALTGAIFTSFATQVRNHESEDGPGKGIVLAVELADVAHAGTATPASLDFSSIIQSIEVSI